jgi:ferredoxin
MSRAKVNADRSACVGSKTCVALVPDVFGTDEAGKVTIGDSGSARLEELIDAALSCPVAAIDIRDAETGEDLVG